MRARSGRSRRCMKSKAPATWDEAELLQVSMTSRKGTADAEALGVKPRAMAAVLGAAARPGPALGRTPGRCGFAAARRAHGDHEAHDPAVSRVPARNAVMRACAGSATAASVITGEPIRGGPLPARTSSTARSASATLPRRCGTAPVPRPVRPLQRARPDAPGRDGRARVGRRRGPRWRPRRAGSPPPSPASASLGSSRASRARHRTACGHDSSSVNCPAGTVPVAGGAGSHSWSGSGSRGRAR